MTKIFLNTEELRNIDQDNKSVNDIIVDIMADRVDVHETITSILFDDFISDKLPPEKEREYFKAPAQQFGKITIETKNRFHLAFETLHSLSLHLTYVNKQIILLAGMYRQQATKETHELFTQLVDSLDLFIESFQTIKSVLKQKIVFPDHLNMLLKTHEGQLVHHLQKVLESHQSKNMLMVADLIEYELAPCINKWNEEIIPSMAKLKSLI